LVAAVGVLALFAASCSDDDDADPGPSASNTCTTKATADQLKAVDASGDGKLTVGVITPGPRNDGAYYQSLVECVDRLVKANGGTSIVVDQVKEADAATQMENLAKQNPDIIMVGASEIGKPLADLSKTYDKIYWYCNCGAGQQPVATYSQSVDDASEISFSAGYASGLLMKAAKKSKAAFVGNNKDALNFENESFLAFEMGVKAVDSTYTVAYNGAGDFNDVQKATAAYNAVKADAGVVYPYLGGAHEAIVKLANADKIPVMSAGKSDACTRNDVSYQIAVRFDAGDYLDPIFKEILSGAFKEGSIREFHVGKDPQPGAVICKPTGDQKKAMEQVFTDIAGGKYANEFLNIKKTVYKF
jgi:basic membrane protein A